MLVELFAISGIINAVVALGFGLLVFLKSWRSQGSVIFLLMTISLAVWGFGYWQWLSQSTAEQALFWVRFFSLGSMFIPLLFLHWVLTVLRVTQYRYIWILYIIALSITAFSFSSLFIPTVSEKSIFLFWPDAGPLYTIYFLTLYAGVVIYSVFTLFSAYFNKKYFAQKGQILYLLLGAVLGFGGGVTNFPLWWDIPILPFGTFFVAAFPFLFGYSIIKHRLFDLKAIAAELLVFFMLMVLAIQAILSESWLEATLRSVFLLMVGVIGVLLVRSVYREVESRQEIQRLADNLKQANEKLKELDKLKSQFLSIASHDLRAPLSVVRNFLSLVFEGTYGKVPPAMQEGLQQVFDRATDMAKSVDAYLNISRIEQGKMQYDFAEADLVKIVSETASFFKEPAEKKGLTYTFRGPMDLKPLSANVDAPKVREVLSLLIDNSIKYTPSGSVAVSIEKNGMTARIMIKDTGIGISKETMPKLFRLFSTAEDSRKTNTSSTGVGLYVVKAHIEAHKGKVWAESEGEGKGSTFIIELPLAK